MLQSVNFEPKIDVAEKSGPPIAVILGSFILLSCVVLDPQFALWIHVLGFAKPLGPDIYKILIIIAEKE